MRVVNEHECSYLEYQNVNENDVIAVQEMVNETEYGIKDNGWYWVLYSKKQADIAIGIRCCPYCGKKLRK